MAELATASWWARYRAWRRPAEIGFWVAVLLLQASFNAGTDWIEQRRTGAAVAAWQPVALEMSSALVIGILIPLLLAWERRHPLRLDTLPASLGWHLLGSLVFAGLHLAGMQAVREAVWQAAGSDYPDREWLGAFGYEYLKDVRTYFLILLAVTGYRLLLLRAQGEARVLDPPEPPAGSMASGDPPASRPPPEPPPRPERFLVRKLRKEFLVAAADIDWLQAQGNYVGLRVQGHDYLVRSTLADFLDKLDPARFVRVHRSWAVNLDRVAEIEPLEGGDARLKMRDGSLVPCSRRWRDALGRPG